MPFKVRYEANIWCWQFFIACGFQITACKERKVHGQWRRSDAARPIDEGGSGSSSRITRKDKDDSMKGRGGC